MRFIQQLMILVLAAGSLTPAAPSRAAGLGVDTAVAAAPDTALAAEIFGLPGPVELVRDQAPVPGWTVLVSGRVAGYLASTWEVSKSVGYSGQPIEILVGVSSDARIVGARLIRHNEPILTLGISTEDIARYVDAFAGLDLKQPHASTFDSRADLPDIITGATVSTGVIRDAILRTARVVANAHAILGGGVDRIDRVSFEQRGWEQLMTSGALKRTTVSLDTAHDALAAAKLPPPTGNGAFLDMWVSVLDPPTIGKSLLGQQGYTRAMASLGPGQFALFVASRGLHSHRGTGWRKTGEFDRIRLIQGDEAVVFNKDDYRRIDTLATRDAPKLKEMSLFRVPADRIDPARPFLVEVIARRKSTDGEVLMRIPLDYVLPAEFLLARQQLPEH